MIERKTLIKHIEEYIADNRDKEPFIVGGEIRDIIHLHFAEMKVIIDNFAKNDHDCKIGRGEGACNACMDFAFALNELNYNDK